MQAYLVISQGSRWTDIFRLQKGVTVVIGRSSDNQIVIRDDRASRRHAEISLREGAWVVRDLGSRNGTQVNDRTLADDHILAEGDSIVVAGCRMNFVLDLAQAFGPAVSPNSSSLSQVSSAQTVELGQAPPTIVGRRTTSRWSTTLSPDSLARGSAPRALSVTNKDTTAASPENDTSFLYRLMFELVSIHSVSELAQCALDRLLDRLGVEAGGVVLLQQSPTQQTSQQTTQQSPTQQSPTQQSPTQPAATAVTGTGTSPLNTPSTTTETVIAARQSPGQSYHRVSDFLIASILRDHQAVLARNVQTDANLSLARESGQRQTSSIICAPLKQKDTLGKTQVIGLLHVYSSIEQRMLTDADLELSMAVADTLSLALVHQRSRDQISASLAISQRKLDLLEKELDAQYEMVGSSSAMQKVRVAIDRCAPTEATVLVRGESGVGKELVARAIHARSKRREGPLVCLNCAALAPTLLESELFGHEKGSFTGATERKIGKFEAANGGTLMLDEIGEMIPELQAKFLRVLEGQPFERLGGNKPIHTSVRVIAATNRDLEQAVREKQFRSDLYFRLRVVEIDVPPLRERHSDIPLLANYFLGKLRQHAARRIDGISPAALEMLTRYSWPGNVRELRNVIERAVVLGFGSTIEPEELALAPLGQSTVMSSTSGSADATDISKSNGSYTYRPITLEQLEREHILATLSALQGNKSRAAIALGVERSTLDRKLKRYESQE